jgi:hypothetical protein
MKPLNSHIVSPHLQPEMCDSRQQYMTPHVPSSYISAQ